MRKYYPEILVSPLDRGFTTDRYRMVGLTQSKSARNKMARIIASMNQIEAKRILDSVRYMEFVPIYGAATVELIAKFYGVDDRAVYDAMHLDHGWIKYLEIAASENVLKENCVRHYEADGRRCYEMHNGTRVRVGKVHGMGYAPEVLYDYRVVLFCGLRLCAQSYTAYLVADRVNNLLGFSGHPATERYKGSLQETADVNKMIATSVPDLRKYLADRERAGFAITESEYDALIRTCFESGVKVPEIIWTFYQKLICLGEGRNVQPVKAAA